ncbi:hypothetical protein OAP44_02460 [Candidatus Pelagibacter sp.]|nr:hypothetical protein [Candidatus Pelagibacter sp.]
MNDILTIVFAGMVSCIILDILGYLLKLIGIPEPSFLIRHSLYGLAMLERFRWFT